MFKVKILKVLDKNPPNPCSTRMQTPYMPPLNLATLTAFLRDKGIEVEQDDLNIKFYYDEYHFNNNANVDIIDLIKDSEIIEYIKTNRSTKIENIIKGIIIKTKLKNVELLLLSGDIAWVSLFATYIKNRNNIYIGSYISLDKEDIAKFHKLILDHRKIDFFVHGPGEKPVFNIIEKLRKNFDIKNLRGLIYLNKNKIVINKKSKPVLPIKPDFNGLPLEKYKWNLGKKFSHRLIKEKKDILILPFRFIIGCPHQCAFCSCSGEDTLIHLKPKIVVKYLKELSIEYNTKFFFFMHDTLNFSNKYVTEICQEIIKNQLKIYWTDCASFKNLDRNTLINMKKAGCINLIFGIETGSPRLLDYINKGISLRQASNCLMWANELGIWTGIEVIAGLPTEQNEDINKTISFIKKNKEYIDNVFYEGFFLTKNSKFWKCPDRYGLTNIRKVKNNGRTRYDRISHTKYAFDELGGLPWQEKHRQINHSYSKTRFNSPISQKYLNFEQMPFLFFLYEKFKNKQIIQKINDKVMRRIYRGFILDTKHIKRYIFEIKSIKELFKKVFYFFS